MSGVILGARDAVVNTTRQSDTGFSNFSVHQNCLIKYNLHGYAKKTAY